MEYGRRMAALQFHSLLFRDHAAVSRACEGLLRTLDLTLGNTCQTCLAASCCDSHVKW